MAGDYLGRVREAYQGEVYGEALFRGLKERAGSREQAYKWRVLEQLERETKLRLRALVEDLGGETDEEIDQLERGESDAAFFARIPWDAFMSGFRRELQKFIDAFEELETLGRPGDAGVLAAVTEHERALLAFAEAELAGDGESSLAPIVRLLEEVPPRR